ncbi:MAG: hypothetical protein HRU29_10430 [Rhizobiales bacterium]|nr:hypothetical protein [Hyphomicrobiales bacterium]NRB14807.1 hypothetical protein [Hyphomicrobiales bacterium]
MNIETDQIMPKTADLNSNIKSHPANVEYKMPKNKRTKHNKVGMMYFLSWGAMAVFSIASLSVIVLNEGGVNNAMQTAAFNKLNRQITENRFLGGDSLPTASITLGGRSNSVNSVTVPNKNKFIPFGEEATATVIGSTYFAVYLGQSDSKAKILDLWYQTKSKNSMLFGLHEAAYHYDKASGKYNLVVGKFVDLNQTIQFCAELKFNDIACQYDEKYVNMQTTSIN